MAYTPLYPPLGRVHITAICHKARIQKFCPCFVKMSSLWRCVTRSLNTTAVTCTTLPPPTKDLGEINQGVEWHHLLCHFSFTSIAHVSIGSLMAWSPFIPLLPCTPDISTTFWCNSTRLITFQVTMILFYCNAVMQSRVINMQSVQYGNPMLV